MKRNTAGQKALAMLLNTADATPFTGSASVTVSKDGATAVAGAGGATTHVGGGLHAYTPTQAETDAANITFVFSGTGAASAAVQYITESDANIIAVAADTTSPTNLRDMFNGAGYTDAEAPAKQIQLDNIASVGSAVNQTAYDHDLLLGTLVSGTLTDTESANNVSMDFQDDNFGGGGSTGAFDVRFKFNIGSSNLPASVSYRGRVNGGNDDCDVYVYNYTTMDWRFLGNVDGKNGSSNDDYTWDLFTNNVDPVTGEVEIRFYTSTGQSDAILRVDQIFISYSVVYQSVGYANGMVWVDTTKVTATGTTLYVDGVADNPVNNWADAKVIANNLGIKRFHITAGSSIVLDDDTSGKFFDGEGYFLDLNNQNIDNCTFFGAIITGVSPNTQLVKMRSCQVSTMEIGAFYGESAMTLDGTLTLRAGDVFTLNDCNTIDRDGAIIDFQAAIGSTDLILSRFEGQLNVQNMGTDDRMIMSGRGELTINVNCTAGTVYAFGDITVFDNSGGAVTIIRSESQDEIKAILADTNELQQNQGNWLTATGFSTFNPATDTVENVNNVITETKANITQILGSGLTETSAGRLANNFDFFYDNSDAQTTKTVDDVGTATGGGGGEDWSTAEKNQIRYRLGIDGASAAPSATADLATQASIDALKDLSAADVWAYTTRELTSGSGGATAAEIWTYTTRELTSSANFNDIAATDIVSAGPINTLAGAIVNVDTVDTCTTNTDMRGTNGANTVEPDNAGILAAITALNNLSLEELQTELAALNDISEAQVKAQVTEVVTVDPTAEPTSVPAANASMVDKLAYIFANQVNKIMQTSTTQTLRNSTDTANIATASVSDDGTTTTKGKSS